MVIIDLGISKKRIVGGCGCVGKDCWVSLALSSLLFKERRRGDTQRWQKELSDGVTRRMANLYTQEEGQTEDQTDPWARKTVGREGLTRKKGRK